MNIGHSCMIYLLGTVLLSGCAHQQARWDATQLRDRALDYYSDQVMDNLIRAKNGQMFLHVDINALNSQISSTLAGEAGGGTKEKTVETGAAGVLSSVTKVTQPFNFSISPERGAELQFHTSPEVNDPNLYALYLHFLKLGMDTTNAFPLLDKIVSIKVWDAEQKPADDVYVPGTLKKWRGKIYYVPKEYTQEFFELSVAVVSRVAPQNFVPFETTKSTNSSLEASPMVLPPKYDSPELRMLEQLENRVNSLK